MKMINRLGLATALTLPGAVQMPRPFDNDGPKWAADDNGAIKMQDGAPVYLDAAGNETAFDLGSIARANADAARMRRDLQAARDAAKAFEGLDADAARTALETVSKLDDKQLIDAGEVDKVRDRVTTEWTKKFDTEKARADAAESRIQSLVMSNAFANSEFVRDKLNIPADIAQSYFGKHFSYDGEKLTAKDSSGNVIGSSKNIGQDADFAEAIEKIVMAYPSRDRILAPDAHSGGGGSGGGGRQSGGRVMKRSEFDSLSPQEQSSAAARAGKGELQIVD